MPDSPPSVVLAEDDAEMRRLLVCALQRRGLSVMEVATGTALLEILAELRRLGSAPQLLVCDVRMPGLSGFGVIQAARLRGWSIPAMLITAFPDDETLTMAQSLGVAQVFAKPFDMGDFCEAALRLVGKPS